MGLSAKNGWYDKLGRVYIYYTLDEIQEDLNCGHDKATKLLVELDSGKQGFGLIGHKAPENFWMGPVEKVIEKRYNQGHNRSDVIAI